MKLDERQFNEVVSLVKGRETWLDTAAKILPTISILAIGLWSLYEYASFKREHQDLVNKQLNDQLLQMEVEKKRIENEIELSDLEIELAKRRNLQQEAGLRAYLVKEVDDGSNIYLIDYRMTLVNRSKRNISVTYNLLQPYTGRVDLSKMGSLEKISAPNVFQPDFGQTHDQFISWKAHERTFNILDSFRDKYLSEARERYSPQFIGYDGTGDIGPSEDLDISMTYYIQAKSTDWFALFFHARLDDSNEDGDNFSHIEWDPIAEILVAQPGVSLASD
ncbi:hypothetical protein [Aliagarivorans marinus]|uniref:hypothetical protein n=1 Tax=Aliagarivorans marinus TaxID=561965 RepID=UPI0004144A8D|nr:hypothetical protein [Aliagarivorans marinus]